MPKLILDLRGGTVSDFFTDIEGLEIVVRDYDVEGGEDNTIMDRFGDHFTPRRHEAQEDPAAIAAAERELQELLL